ncbi:MAG: toxin-antitoxin system HicB family antitoxin [Chloroflexota bacterium]
MVRVPKSLHRKLVDLAEQDGVSLNQWINTALAEAVGKASSGMAAHPVHKRRKSPGRY